MCIYLPFRWRALAFEIHTIFNIVTQFNASKDFYNVKVKSFHENRIWIYHGILDKNNINDTDH